MAVVRLDQFRSADCFLDAIPLHLEPAAERPFAFDGADNVVERQDVGEEFSENKLDTRYWGSNRSWHEGAGQKRLQVPQVSKPHAFASSKGIDISEKGEATLLHETSVLHASVYTSFPQRLAVANDTLWMVKATATLRRITDIGGTGSDFIAGLTGDIIDLASDGEDLYIATGANVFKIAAGGGSATTFSADDTSVIEWAKDRLFGIRTNAGKRELVEYSSAGATTVIYIFPANLVPVQMADLGPLLYIAVRSTTSTDSWIYAYDGRNAPFVALPMPRGDVVYSLTPFLGAGFLVGARRVKETLADSGVVYIGFPQGSGHIVLLQREIVELGGGDTDNARNYLIERGVTYGRAVYFGWPYDDASGLGIYYPEVGAYARHLHQGSGAVGQIGGITRWRDRLFFTVQGVGLFREAATFVASGQIVSSLIDINVDADKTWGIQESGFEGLGTGTKIGHEHSVDGGATFTGLVEQAAAAATLLRTQRGVVSRAISYRVTLTANTAKTLTPTLLKSGIGGWPVAAPGDEHSLIVRAYPATTERTGRSQHAEDAGWDLFNKLNTRRRSGGTYDFQPPYWPHSQATLKVRIARVATIGPWGTTGARQGGALLVTLKEDL